MMADSLCCVSLKPCRVLVWVLSFTSTSALYWKGSLIYININQENRSLIDMLLSHYQKWMSIMERLLEAWIDGVRRYESKPVYRIIRRRAHLFFSLNLSNPDPIGAWPIHCSR